MASHVSIKLVNNTLGNEIKLDYSVLRKTVLVLRSINHKLRQQILKLLIEHSKMTVTELYIKLRLEQSVASQHLSILRRSGAVITKKEGKFVYYSVDQIRLNEIQNMVKELVQ